MRIISYCIAILLVAAISGCRKSPQPEVVTVKAYPQGEEVIGFQAIQLTNGTFVAAGHEDRNDGTGVLIGVDNKGTRLWTKILPDSVTITGIAATPDGGFVSGGPTITKYSGTGDVMWSSTGWIDSTYNTIAFPQLFYYPNVCVAPDGSIFLFYSVDFADILGDNNILSYYLSKLDPNGNILKINKFITFGNATERDSTSFLPTNMIATGDAVFLTGMYRYVSSHFNVYSSYFCIKADLSDSVQWISCPDNPSSNEPALANVNSSDGLSMALGENNTIIVAGDSANYNMGIAITFDDVGTLYNMFTGQLIFETFNLQNGSLLHSKNMIFPNSNMYPFITATTDGGYIIAFTGGVSMPQTTYTSSFFSNSNVTLVKTDAALNRQWVKAINTPYQSSPFSIFQTTDGGYLVFARYKSFGQLTYDIAAFKTDKTGNLIGD